MARKQGGGKGEAIGGRGKGTVRISACTNNHTVGQIMFLQENVK